MRVLPTILVLVLALSAGAAFAADRAPNTVILQGSMMCMSCYTPLAGTPSTGKPACMAALSTTDGIVYTIVPNDVGKRLENLATAGAKVEVEGYLLPGTRIFEARSYRPIDKFRPVMLEFYDPWFNY